MFRFVQTWNKRRALQFSSRTFMLLVGVFAVWLGWYAHRAERQRAAVRWVEKHGGTVTYQFEMVTHPDALHVVEGEIVLVNGMVPEPPVPAWLLRFLDIHFFSDVVQVDLSLTDIDHVRPLHSLSKLEYLNLGGTRVTDRDIESLEASLADCKIVLPSDAPLLDPFQ